MSSYFTKVLQQIEKRGQGSKYMLPHENMPFLPNTYNCATFWGQTGIILPEKSGILREYIPAMLNQGAEKFELTIIPHDELMKR